MNVRDVLRSLRRRAAQRLARLQPSPWRDDDRLRVLVQATPDFDRELWERALAKQWDDSERRIQCLVAESRLQLLVAARDADVVSVWDLQPELIPIMRKVSWVNSTLSGINLSLVGQLKPSVRVSTSRGVAAQALAEHALMYYLAIRNRLPLALSRQEQWLWSEVGLVTDPGPLIGRHVIVVGLGAAGTAVARLFRSIGLKVTGIRRTDTPHPDCDFVAPLAELGSTLPDADLVVLTVPLDGNTRGLMNSHRIGLMKQGAVLVNVSRGGLVDEVALAAALRSGRLLGAGLDVLEHEPPPSNHPLRDMPGLVITPHTAGRVGKFRVEIATRFARNISAFLEGKPIEGELNR